MFLLQVCEARCEMEGKIFLDIEDFYKCMFYKWSFLSWAFRGAEEGILELGVKDVDGPG